MVLFHISIYRIFGFWFVSVNVFQHLQLLKDILNESLSLENTFEKMGAIGLRKNQLRMRAVANIIIYVVPNS